MLKALEAANAAYKDNEVPVGAALYTAAGDVFSASNTCTATDQPLQHAELKLLNQVCAKFPREVLKGSTLFVTLEPCPMCMGAILHSHVGTLVFGSYNLKWGAAGTVADFRSLFPTDALKIYGGILETECAKLLASFFQSRR